MAPSAGSGTPNPSIFDRPALRLSLHDGLFPSTRERQVSVGKLSQW